MENHSTPRSLLRWLSLSAVAVGGLLAGACAGHHHEGHEVVEPQHVYIEDEHGFRHEGYYDDRHSWHGGYYDRERQFHHDPENWSRQAAEVVHPGIPHAEPAREERREERHDEHHDEHRDDR